MSYFQILVQTQVLGQMKPSSEEKKGRRNALDERDDWK